jgi:D-alanyl-D-alanine carboxypeptidase
MWGAEIDRLTRSAERAPKPDDQSWRAVIGADEVPDGSRGRGVDRRTLLLAAAGGLAGAALWRPPLAEGFAAALAPQRRARVEPVLAHRLQRVLRDALRDPTVHAPGAILHVESPRLGAWTGVAGLARVAPAVPMRREDRFRAGSIAKSFVAVRVLQLAERGRVRLDAPLPEVLPASVVHRFRNAGEITIRMLLGHRSGIPEWETPAIDEQIARNPAKVWTLREKLDLAAAQPPVFAPGTSYAYSNTDYNLLGLVIERVTGRSWRHEVARHVISPLELTRTYLPATGHRSIQDAHMHGYAELDGRRIDLTGVDPSMAGAAGGSALVTTVHDLARFFNALMVGRLFRRHRTLRQMLTFAPAPDVGGQVGYGLGIEQRALPGGVELIGHLGGTAGYRSYVGRMRPHDVTISFALNWQDDPTPLVLPAVKALAAAHR